MFVDPYADGDTPSAELVAKWIADEGLRAQAERLIAASPIATALTVDDLLAAVAVGSLSCSPDQTRREALLAVGALDGTGLCHLAGSMHGSRAMVARLASSIAETTGASCTTLTRAADWLLA